MPSIDDLETGSFLRAEQPGFEARQRQPLPGLTLDETDDLVREAGGVIKVKHLQSNQLGGGRRVDRTQMADWYEIPADRSP
jgi:hypothetical protein